MRTYKQGYEDGLEEGRAENTLWFAGGITLGALAMFLISLLIAQLG